MLSSLFVPLTGRLMGGRGGNPAPLEGGWTIARAERLLNSLTGVISARVVAKPGGEIEEIHLLTTEEATPKQTVRNVESALMAHFDLEVDHRKISVAQTVPDEESGDGEPGAGPGELVTALPVRPPERRILFVGHEAASERSHRIRMRVTLEWEEGRHTGEAEGADLPRARLEAVAQATLRAIEKAVGAEIGGEEADELSLALDGVKVLEAFDRSYVLVAVHAMSGREVTALAGAAGVDDSKDRAVILGTLQATDRWIRGRV